MLASLGGVEGRIVIDLFAGSGSFGLECLSRGADRVTFVEQDRAAVAAIEKNLETLGFGDRSTIVTSPVQRVVPRLGLVDIAFCDPPYRLDLWRDLLSSVKSDILVGHAEREIDLVPGWVEVRRRNYGRAKILIARSDPGDRG